MPACTSSWSSAISELCQRNEDLKLLNDVAAALTSSLDVDEILEKTLDLVMDYLEVEAGEIFLREEDEQELHLALHRGDFDEAFSHLDRFRIGQGFIGMVAATGKMLVSTNLREDMRYLRPAVLEAGFQSIACIPLSSGGKVVGVMAAATRRDRHLDERELNLLTAIGTWAGMTIENARLNRQSRRLAVLEERERIGMDLHDGIIQSIYGVGLALDYARMALDEDPDARPPARSRNRSTALNTTIRDIRSYILDLRPRQFHGDDLKQGLQRLVDEFQANSATRAILVGPEDGLVDFPATNSTALFHICQESLANIAQHSRAQHAEVHLWTTRDRVLLEISDDGRGFDLRKMQHDAWAMACRTCRPGRARWAATSRSPLPAARAPPCWPGCRGAPRKPWHGASFPAGATPRSNRCAPLRQRKSAAGKRSVSGRGHPTRRRGGRGRGADRLDLFMPPIC